MANLLLITILTPLVGAALAWAVAANGRDAVRRVALLTSLVTLGMATILIANFTGGTGPYADLDYAWLPISAGLDIRFSLGLDGVSLWFFGLSALLSVTSILVSWEAIDEEALGFYILLLLLETGMLGVFAARDIILFYIFFEFTLIPLFFLIGVWGSEQRRYAAAKFFIFTLAGSLLTFLGILAIVLWNNSQTGQLTFSIPELTRSLAVHPIHRELTVFGLHFDLQLLIFVALFAGFAIKVPLFPFHTWLPLAHVQAPTAGSVILAGILLKIGTYGFLRFNLPMLPDATAVCAPWLMWLSAAGIVYGALVALAQTDIKRLIAYSSVSHLGFCMLGIFALNKLGLEGGTLQAVNHGLSTGGLFAIVGMIYERYHTRAIADLGGLAARVPKLAAVMVFFTMSSIGLPGLNGFAGEFLLLVGMFQRAWHDPPSGLAFQLRIISVLAVSGVVLGAWYMLWMVQRVFFGPLREPHAPHAAGHNGDEHAHGEVHDMSTREFWALAPLVVFIVWIGLQPQFFLERMSPAVNEVAQRAEQAFDRTTATAQLPQSGAEVAVSGGPTDGQ